MRNVMIFLAIGALVGGAAVSSAGGSPSDELVAGGYEVMLGEWTPGQGNIEPGSKLRGWRGDFEATLVGPAGDLASGSGPVTMNCNLDAGLTGPCWGTFEYSNAIGTWIGSWQGTFNFVTGAGSYRAVAHGRNGLKGMVLQSDVVYPGWAIVGPGKGFLYSTVR